MCCIPVVVSTSEVGVIQTLGKFDRLLSPGLSCIVWPCSSLAGRMSLRVIEEQVQCETKTRDNVFVLISVSVQYQVIADSVYKAFYVLSDHSAQIDAYVKDSVRTSLCSLTLDDAFLSKEEISLNLKRHLQDVMSTYGFRIINALVTDMAPDKRVRDAMNEINSAKRLREAATQTAEGNKVIKVKRAEAEAEAMWLSGVGAARQRKAIMDGLRESIVEFSTDVQDTSPKDVMDLLVLTQYFDTLREIGSQKNTKVVYLASSDDDSSSARTQFIQANLATAAHADQSKQA